MAARKSTSRRKTPGRTPRTVCLPWDTAAPQDASPPAPAELAPATPAESAEPAPAAPAEESPSGTFAPQEWISVTWEGRGWFVHEEAGVFPPGTRTHLRGSLAARLQHVSGLRLRRAG